MNTKICAKCKNSLDILMFSKSSSSKDGLSRICKSCSREECAKWRAKNREYDLQRRRDWREKNTEAVKEQNRKWSLNNPERKKELWLEWASRPENSRLEYNKEYYRKNKEKSIAKSTLWRKSNPEKYSALMEKYKEKLKLASALWRKNNRHIVCAHSKLRHKRLKQATPKWADMGKMLQIYLECSEINKHLKEEDRMHVDHIIPIRGKNVCGLHVHNNLSIVPKSFNLRKRNKYLGEPGATNV